MAVAASAVAQEAGMWRQIARSAAVEGGGGPAAVEERRGVLAQERHPASRAVAMWGSGCILRWVGKLARRRPAA